MSIEGIPEGWELVEIGMPKTGDWMISAEGEPYQVICDHSTFWPIIRKIEKPKQYRHFANAAEFAPHRDRWVEYTSLAKGDTSFYRVTCFSDQRVWLGPNNSGMTFAEAMDQLEFDDHTPFGVEVTE